MISSRLSVNLFFFAFWVAIVLAAATRNLASATLGQNAWRYVPPHSENVLLRSLLVLCLPRRAPPRDDQGRRRLRHQAGEYLIKDVAMRSIEKKIESDKAKVAMAAD